MSNKTYIVTISDTHCQHDDIEVPYGDILIHAGDFSGRGTKWEIESFLNWFGSLPHPWKIVIPGNHDKGTDPDVQGQVYQGCRDYFKQLCALENIYVLEDDCVDVYTNSGELIKIWGSPVSPTFGRGWAWNRDRGSEIKKHWDKIPEDVDIVVAHGPPFGYGDRVDYPNHTPNGPLYNVGCVDLLRRLSEVKPKMGIYGHIHEDRGVFFDERNKITHVNTSSLNIRYRPYGGKAFRFDWDKVKEMKSNGDDYAEEN